MTLTYPCTTCDHAHGVCDTSIRARVFRLETLRCPACGTEQFRCLNDVNAHMEEHHSHASLAPLTSRLIESSLSVTNGVAS